MSSFANLKRNRAGFRFEPIMTAPRELNASAECFALDPVIDVGRRLYRRHVLHPLEHLLQARLRPPLGEHRLERPPPNRCLLGHGSPAGARRAQRAATAPSSTGSAFHWPSSPSRSRQTPPRESLLTAYDRLPSGRTFARSQPHSRTFLPLRPPHPHKRRRVPESIRCP